MLSAPAAAVVVSAYQPQFVNLTPGASVKEGMQARIGRWIETAFYLTGGTGFAMGTAPAPYWHTHVEVALTPRAAVRSFWYDVSAPVRNAGHGNAVTNLYTWSGPLVSAANQTYLLGNTPTATAPFTWAVGDKVSGYVRGIALT